MSRPGFRVLFKFIFTHKKPLFDKFILIKYNFIKFFASTFLESCNFWVFVIYCSNQFGWHCEACRMACLPPSYLRRGIRDWDWEYPILIEEMLTNLKNPVFVSAWAIDILKDEIYQLVSSEKGRNDWQLMVVNSTIHEGGGVGPRVDTLAILLGRKYRKKEVDQSHPSRFGRVEK